MKKLIILIASFFVMGCECTRVYDGGVPVEDHWKNHNVDLNARPFPYNYLGN